MPEFDVSRRHYSDSGIPENPPNLVNLLGLGDFPVSSTDIPVCKLCLERDAVIYQAIHFEGKIYRGVPICPICFLAVWSHGFAVGNDENPHQIPLFDSEPS